MKPALRSVSYSPIIHRPRLTWPDGAHVAFWVIPNIEFFSLMDAGRLRRSRHAAAGHSDWSARDYGNRVGVFRLMQVLDRHGVRATVALNSDLCAYHPEIIAEGETPLGMDGALRGAPPPRLRGRRRARRRASSGARSPPSRRRPAPGGRLARLRLQETWTRSICWPPRAANMSATGPTTTSPT